MESYSIYNKKGELIRAFRMDLADSQSWSFEGGWVTISEDKASNLLAVYAKQNDIRIVKENA